MITAEKKLDERLELKVATTKEELEDCFRILHDAYVESGFMKPHPSGLRVTPYHALPTTSTLCAKWEGKVVGTVSLVREGAFGLPLQAAYDLSTLRAVGGNITEVSALAVDKSFRQNGGAILFSLMQYLYRYSVRCFDTRHLAIAVNPNRIELYEALLLFTRLPAAEVATYDFANGAPAVGATLDCAAIPRMYHACYNGCKPEKDLYRYIVAQEHPNNQYPDPVLCTTNHPVMTPKLLDYFFNQKTQGFANMTDDQKTILHEIYHGKAFKSVLPPVSGQPQIRSPRHGRYCIKLPGQLSTGDDVTSVTLEVVELAKDGGRVRFTGVDLHGLSGHLTVKLGAESTIAAQVALEKDGEDHHYSFTISAVDQKWAQCATLLRKGYTHSDLLNGLVVPL